MNSDQILNSLNDALQQTSLIEWYIFVSAVIYIILIALEKSAGWIFGIIASALSIYLCFKANLYFESFLNLFYVVIGGYGWHQWMFGSKTKSHLPITELTLAKNLLLIAAGIIIFTPLGFVAHNYSTQALPYLDAFITAFSIIATWMTAKKMIENWLYWIVIDMAGIFLFSSRGFYLLALLNIIYTLMATAGYFSWRKKIAA
ncbi:MAG: nicotinamide mononucleotide transporter [Bacteroidetes bacterium]|nr:nicotinamide mononucleotide transporter [Bacteroidota bacterium]